MSGTRRIAAAPTLVSVALLRGTFNMMKSAPFRATNPKRGCGGKTPRSGALLLLSKCRPHAEAAEGVGVEHIGQYQLPNHAVVASPFEETAPAMNQAA